MQSHQPRLEQTEALNLLEEYFTDEMVESNSVHSFYTCLGSCTQLSQNEQEKSEKLRDKFQHKWLFEESLAFLEETGMCWLICVEGQGMFCLLCRIHNTKNRFNKDSKFNNEPSVRFKRSALFNSRAQRSDRNELGHL